MVKGSEFDEALFFRAISQSGLRALLIGRRALIADGPLVFDDSDICVPSLEDLIASKRIGSRPKDAEDVRLLQQLRKQREAL